MRNYLYQGAVAPASIAVAIVPGEVFADLSTVTSAELLIRRGRDGSEETLTDVNIEEQSAARLLLRHTCPTPTHFPDPDWIRVVPRLLTAGGAYRCAPRYLQIRRVS